MTAVTAEPRAREPRRFRGKPFAIGLGAFLIVATVLFYYFAERATLARQDALRRMEEDGALTP